MKIFDARSLSEFLKSKIRASERGELQKLSLATEIHTTTLSQIVNGVREASLEQGLKFSDYFGFSELETKCLLALIQTERAGTNELKKFFQKELEEIREQETDLNHVIKKDRVLSDEEKALFYSDWYYTGIAVLTSISRFSTVEAIAEHTGLSLRRVKETVGFLVRTGICVEKNGKLTAGSKSTHLDSKSPLISRHHSNWRIKAMQNHPNLPPDELAYSAPMSISKADAKKVHKLAVEFVRKVGEIRDPSPCEEAYCLNLDWFKIVR